MLWLLVILLGLLLACLVLSWVLYLPVMMRFFQMQPRLAAELGREIIGGEEYEFQSADGLTLRGSYLTSPIREPRGVIVFCHELTGQRWSATRYIEQLLDEGYDLFTFDFRNHGRSETLEGYTAMPWITEHEIADLQSAVNFVSDRHSFAPLPIGLFGVSRGGTAALCVAARDRRVRAVVADGAFPIDSMLRFYMRKYALMTKLAPLGRWLPDWALISYCKWCTFLVGRKNRCKFPAVEKIVRHVEQPVFLITGERDPYVPVCVTSDLRLLLRGRTKLWIVPKAKHNAAIQLVGPLYRQRIGRFFRRHLSPKQTIPVDARRLVTKQKPLVSQSV